VDGPLRLDLRGLNCPLPVLKTRRAMARLPVGATVVVEATDPLSGLDIPNFCREDGHRLLEQAVSDGVFRFVIARGG